MEPLRDKLRKIKDIFRKRLRTLRREKPEPVETPEDRLKSQLRTMLDKADVTQEDNAELKNRLRLYISSTDPTHPFLTPENEACDPTPAIPYTSHPRRAPVDLLELLEDFAGPGPDLDVAAV